MKVQGAKGRFKEHSREVQGADDRLKSQSRSDGRFKERSKSNILVAAAVVQTVVFALVQVVAAQPLGIVVEVAAAARSGSQNRQTEYC